MRKNATLFLFLCFTTTLFAQKQAYNWYFGVFAGINFDNLSPTALTGGQIYTTEGCATISDTSGNLLFYTDGVSVWNNQHSVMPNGTGLLGGISSTQSSLIVPQPGNDSIYYLFTTDEIGGPNGFEYSIVNMNLQSGLGDVTTKNNLIQFTVTEKLTAVANTDGSKIWVLVHEWGTNAFYAYALTSTGLNLTPVISNTGIVHSFSVIQNTYGQMKFSSCGDRLGVAISYQDTVQVFNFNTTTGEVFNPISIPMPDHVYGLEFSGSGQKLYVTCYDPDGTLIQYDLGAGNAADILASYTALSTTEDLYGLQLAPDGRIYVDHSWSSFLNVINDPELPGIACNYAENAFNLDPNYLGITSSLGLPNFVQSYFDQGHKGCTVFTTAEENTGSTESSVYPNPTDGILYLDGSFFMRPNVKASLININGQNIIDFNFTSAGAGKKIDLSLLKSGIYLLVARTNEGQLMQKIVLTSH